LLKFPVFRKSKLFAVDFLAINGGIFAALLLGNHYPGGNMQYYVE